MKTILFFFLSCYCYVAGNAQNLYGLDPTFANNGLYLGDTGICVKMAIQQDGKIVVTSGEWVNGVLTLAMRFNTNGSKDNNFANSGFFYLPPALANYFSLSIHTIHTQADDKILLGGAIELGSPFAGDDLFLIRLKPNGELDSTFGTNGCVITALSGDEYFKSVAIQPDGKVLAYGYWQGIEQRLVVLRYHIDGSLDSSFGTNGIVFSETSWGFRYPTPNDIELLQDGRILIGGKAKIFSLNPPSGNKAFIAVRLLQNGSLDTSFNHTGIAYTNTNLHGLLYCKALSLQPDGKVLLGGYADSLVVVRFDTTGNLDNSFGVNGLKKLDTLGRLEDMLVQPDGKIVAGIEINNSLALYRLKTNGSMDSTFGINGKVLTASPAPNLNIFLCVALQQDGKLLAGGAYFDVSSDGKVMLARYTPNATSIQDVEFLQSISIYPNPATNYVEIYNKTGHVIEQLSIYSLDGKLLYSCSYSHTQRIDTDGLAIGMYLLKIRFANHATTTRKLIIQKN